MRVLLSAISFEFLTGAEMYVYELGRELVRRGHEVTVIATRIKGAMEAPARAAGLRCDTFGDLNRQGVRSLGVFDIIHVSEPSPTRWILEKFPTHPIICTIHSQYPCEEPIIDPRIRHYICIRPEVQQKVINQNHIPAEKTSLIYNPIDFARFRGAAGHPRNGKSKRVLFCGTMDALRRQTIFDLMRRAPSEGFELWLLGLKADGYNGYLECLPPGVAWFDQTWTTERYINQCDETAGVLLGRTTIEGWACGKPGWIYDIDLQGNIRSRALHQTPADMNKFDSVNVVNQIEELYKRYGRPKVD